MRTLAIRSILLTSAAASGVTTTVTTTEATPDATPAPAPAAPVPAVPELDAASKAALANWNVMYGPGRDGSWAPVGGEGGIPDDPVGPIGFGKAAILAKRPPADGKEVPKDCFVIEDRPLPTVAEAGTAIIQNIYISLDPTHRIWMCGMDQYMPPVGINTVMRAITIGKCVMSSDESKLAVGDYVSAFGGVQEYSLVNLATDIGTTVNPVVPGVPLSYNLSILSMVIGHTAWIGTTQICKPTAGETFVVSGGAGAVGSVSGQLAKVRGARVVGIAGSKAKCDWMTNELGFDVAINYKTENMKEALSAAAPDGIDCYFDNVGGSITDEVMGQMNRFGRLAFCGAISTYTNYGDAGGAKPPGPNNWSMILMRRLTVQGFVCIDHGASIMEGLGEIGGLLQEGKMKFNEDARDTGIENYVDSVNLLYTSKNTGKLMMKIAAE